MRRLLVAALALGSFVPPAHAARPFMTGVVEGYYGRPWSGDARRDVIRFLGAHGMNTFVYGPKNDPYHRDDWRAPYPADALADLAATARAARRAKVRFVYALSPALDVCYTCADDQRALRRKLRQLVRAKVKRFALFFDDAAAALTHPEDVAHYGDAGPEAAARAQADLVRRTNAWLRRRGLPPLAFMVPTDYFGTACSPYLTALDAALPTSTPVGWTGTAVVPATIGATEAAARRACVSGRPLVLWDNYPVNDAVLSSNLHLGPFTGRAADLATALGGGHLLNPMTQAHASLVALGTAAAYFADPAGYDPETAWHATLAELAPAGTLDVLAEQTRSSALDLDDARPLAALIDGVVDAHQGARWEPAVGDLAGELDRQAIATDAIDAALGDTPLGLEIAPWVAELRTNVAQAHDAAILLSAMKPSLVNVQLVTADGTRRVQGYAAGPDEPTIGDLGPALAAVAPPADLQALLACLGPYLTADIHFCPELGLNVHGKRLYVALGVPIAIVSGRNQIDRLRTFAIARWEDWLARNGEPPVLSLLVDGSPIPLGPGGSFDAAVSPSGPVVVTAVTTAGDATERTLP